MDDIKAIEMMEKFFVEIALGQKRDTGIDYTDIERRELALKLRKTFDKVLDWYEANKGKKTGEQPLTRFSIYAPLPEIDPKEIPGVAPYAKKLMPILQDFNSRGISRLTVEAYFDSYLDKIKQGWNKAFDDLKKKGSG